MSSPRYPHAIGDADYDIDPPGVAKVLKSTAGPAKDLGIASKVCSSNLGHAVPESQSALIAKAIKAFADYHEGPLKETFRRVVACPEGAATATLSYINGDEEMLRQAQRNSAKAVQGPDPRSLGWAHGGVSGGN
jgi:hypothetical protein